MRRARRAALVALYVSPGYTGFKGSQISHRRALEPTRSTGVNGRQRGHMTQPERLSGKSVPGQPGGGGGGSWAVGGVGRGAMAYDVRGVCLVVCDWMRCDTWVVYGRVIGGGW